jgi:2-polyprenyl-3-methyl-5-hydroxy-6-metoxy-1,4-benzoquinol methylase
MEYMIKCNFITSRDSYFVEKSKNKRVLHIGACDSPYTLIKSQTGLLLHEKLDKVTSYLMGIDIDKSAITIMNNLGFKNIECIDFNNLSNINKQFDIIILGETLEHLMNFETSLQNIKKIMNKKTELLISTPNAFYINNFRYSLYGKEKTHPDHKMLFSYQTIKNLLHANDFEINEFLYSFLDREHNNLMKKLTIAFTRLAANALAETLILSCSIK